MASERRVVSGVAGQFFVNGAVLASFIPRLPEIRDRVGVGVDGIGLLLAGAALFGLLGSSLVGRVMAMFTTRQVMLGGGMGLVAGLAAVGLASSPVALFVALATMAFSDILVDAAMNLQASWLSARRTVPVIHRMHGLWSVGTVTAGLISSQVAAAGISVSVHLVVAAVVLLTLIWGLGSGLPRVDIPADDLDEAAGGSGPRTLWTIALLGGFALAVEIASSDWAAFRLTDDLGAGPGVASLAYVAFTVGMTAGRFSGDSLEARFGRAALSRGTAVLAMVAVSVAAFVPSVGWALAAYGLAGLGIGPLFPRLYDDASRRPGRRGSGLGALSAGSRMADLSVPATVGALAATDWAVGTAVAIVALPGLLGLLAMSRPQPDR